MPLGSLLGPLEALLGGLWTQKRVKNNFFKDFEKAVFWSLKLLMALCVHLGCFLGKSGPKMGFQNGCQKWSLKTLKIEFNMR